MKTKDEIIAILRTFKEEFGEIYGIEKLGLFGSVARGEQKENSDIDICIQLQAPDYFTRMEIKESLEKRFSAKVDVVSLTAIMRLKGILYTLKKEKYLPSATNRL